VTVSPTFAAANSLMPAMMKPTCPADSDSRFFDFGVNTPTCSTGYCAPVAIMRILSLGRSVPLTIRTSITTPT
jgi:hypothetical protein